MMKQNHGRKGTGMKLIYGTTNPAKLNLMREFLSGTGLEIIGLSELPEVPEEPGEYGSTPLENARGKAEYYYQILQRPVFSCDSGLIIEGLSQKEQPGVHVRRREGRILTDSEMTEYYSGIADRFGGRCLARYQNGICFIFSDRERYEYDGEDISGESFWLVSQAKPQKEKGFPLDCISVDRKTGRYFVDGDHDMEFWNEENGFRRFWKRVIEAHAALEADQACQKEEAETERIADGHDEKTLL